MSGSSTIRRKKTNLYNQNQYEYYGSSKTILKKNNKKDHAQKYCNNSQCFKEKTTKLNSQPDQY